jgi:hypothetical protein
MANSKKGNKKEELIIPRKSVHVIFLSCPHCGNERDHIEICEKCGEPMRVIDVVEKFGEDAERLLKRMEKRKEKNGTDLDDDDISIDEEEPNIILMGNEEALNGDNGIDPTEDEVAGLGEIFPEDNEDAERKDVVVEADDDLAKALEELDSEEDDDLTAEDFGFEDGEIPTL